MESRIGIIGDFNPEFAAHVTTDSSLSHAAERHALTIAPRWIPTDSLSAATAAGMLEELDGLWISAGSPYRSREGALAAIRFARERGRPMVAT